MRDLRDPQRASGGLTAILAAFGALICAVPMGGILVFLLGVFYVQWGKSKLQRVLPYHRTRPLDAISTARPGEEASLLGRIRTPAEQRTPVGGLPAAVATIWLDDDFGDDVESGAASFTSQLGERLELDADGGEIVVEGGSLSLLSEHVRTVRLHGGEPPPGVELTDEQRAALPKDLEEYGERWLPTGAEVVVTGIVTDVRESPGASASYRGRGLARRVTLGPRDQGSILVSSFSPARVVELAREASAQRLTGWIYLVLGPGSVAVWARWLWGT